MYIGDVGESLREEVNRLPRSFRGIPNFGWNIFEGGIRHRPDPKDTRQDLTRRPLSEYPTRKGRCDSVVGGYVYRGRRVPSLRGRYVYGDLCGGVWSVPGRRGERADTARSRCHRGAGRSSPSVARQVASCWSLASAAASTASSRPPGQRRVRHIALAPYGGTSVHPTLPLRCRMRKWPLAVPSTYLRLCVAPLVVADERVVELDEPVVRIVERREDGVRSRGSSATSATPRSRPSLIRAAAATARGRPFATRTAMSVRTSFRATAMPNNRREFCTSNQLRRCAPAVFPAHDGCGSAELAFARHTSRRGKT